MNKSLREIITANPTATAEQVLALAQADLRTVRAIPIVDLEGYGATIGLTARFTATMASEACPAELKAGLAALAEIRGNLRFENIHSELAQFASAVGPVLLGLVALNAAVPAIGITQAEADAILLLAGGFVLGPAVTLAQVQAELDALASETAQAAVFASYETGRDRMGRAFAAVAKLWDAYRDGKGPLPTMDNEVSAWRVTL